MSKIKNHENVCEPAVRYKFLKKLGIWCRTWFTIEKGEDGWQFKQNNAFSEDRAANWDKWRRKP